MIKKKKKLISILTFYLIITCLFSCKEKEKVCEWLKKVVAIKTPTMIASGIFLSDSIIVTNRHVVEDSKAVLVRMPNKKIIKAFTIPNNHTADIAFISLTKNIQSIKFNFDHSQPKKTRMIAFDIDLAEVGAIVLITVAIANG